MIISMLTIILFDIIPLEEKQRLDYFGFPKLSDLDISKYSAASQVASELRASD